MNNTKIVGSNDNIKQMYEDTIFAKKEQREGTLQDKLQAYIDKHHDDDVVIKVVGLSTVPSAGLAVVAYRYKYSWCPDEYGHQSTVVVNKNPDLFVRQESQMLRQLIKKLRKELRKAQAINTSPNEVKVDMQISRKGGK